MSEAHLSMFLQACVGRAQPCPALSPAWLQLYGCQRVLHSVGMLLQSNAGSSAVAEVDLVCWV